METIIKYFHQNIMINFNAVLSNFFHDLLRLILNASSNDDRYYAYSKLFRLIENYMQRIFHLLTRKLYLFFMNFSVIINYMQLFIKIQKCVLKSNIACQCHNQSSSDLCYCLYITSKYRIILLLILSNMKQNSLSN